MREVEFIVSLSGDGREFVVCDRAKMPAQHARLRAALEEHRDRLRERLIDLELLLAGADPECAERTMIDGASARVDRIVLRAGRPVDPRRLDAELERILTDLGGRGGRDDGSSAT